MPATPRTPPGRPPRTHRPPPVEKASGDRQHEGLDEEPATAMDDEPAEPVALAFVLGLVEGDDHVVQGLLDLGQLRQGLDQLCDPLFHGLQLRLLRGKRAADRVDRFRKVVQLELDRQHPGFDRLDVRDQLLRLVAQMFVAEQRHHVVGATGDTQAVVDREQAGLRRQDVGKHRHRERSADLALRHLPEHPPRAPRRC